jgi:hypothetical protein
LLQEELDRLRTTFLNNGFPLEAINRIMEMKTHLNHSNTDEATVSTLETDFSKAFYAPYHPHARRMFQKLKKQLGMTCIYQKTPTLGNFLFKRRPPPPLWELKNSVYSVPCTQDPNHQYIGQRKRKLRVKIMEHQKKSCLIMTDLSNIQPESNFDNGIPFHLASTGHSFDFNSTKILEQEPNSFKRRILESIHITNKQSSTVNIISGQRISPCWIPIIRRRML